ncbi:expressed unknown protein [Seminavis robusta]|uniref:Dynamin N-terminal domain-containing protein n=1 Tax=Seminavis robusta TaxID=568900 RepID=A0A9N8DU36_9STRA|nr:expressed unknown protein [Seminavis robusta]|eukprot:Sro372_g128870.1 n/a (624) ;mRNA; f:54860-56939
MTIFNTFEIKIALLGYVSVGKTTVLNALFRDKFSEVSARRTTAGINYFRCMSQGAVAPGEVDTGETWSPVSDGSTANAQEVLQEIVETNKVLREAKEIQEKWFNIELEAPFAKSREDTSIVVVEIPGLNEAGSKSIFSNYVNEHWTDFDCVVLVMDSRQGVNTEEQVKLLRMVKTNLSKKEVPVIILFNKVDEPDDEEQAELLSEARAKISEVFQVGDRSKALEETLKNPNMSPSDYPTSMYPVVIPISAIHAFFYRTASLLTFDEFRGKFDMSLIERIGREEMGRFKWKKLTEEEKYLAVYEAVREDESYEERLAATNFDKFLSTLSLAVGGNEVQTELLLRQLNLEIQHLSTKTASSEHVRSIYEKTRVLGKDMEALKGAVWAVYRLSRDDALGEYEDEYRPKGLLEAMTFLCNYFACIHGLDWQEEEKMIKHEARKLVRWQLGTIIKKQNLLEYDAFLGRGQQYQLCRGCRKPVANAKSWKSLSIHDWISIFESTLLMSCNQSFCESFGREKIVLSQLKDKFITFKSKTCRCKVCSSEGFDCSSCGRSMHQPDTCPTVMETWNVEFLDGSLTIKEGASAKNFVTIPALLSDEKHFGHLAWKCCKLIDAIEKKKSARSQGN